MPQTKLASAALNTVTCAGGRPRSRLPLLATFAALGALAVQLGAGCGDDDLPTNRGGVDGGVIFGDAADDTDPSASCPATPPRIGEACPGISETRLTCTFKVGECVQPGTSHDVTVDYCCVRGGNWDLCGANTTPCDNQPRPESQEADAGAPDAAADAPAAD